MNTNAILQELNAVIVGLIGAIGFGLILFIRYFSMAQAASKKIELNEKERKDHGEQLDLNDRVDLKKFLLQELSEIKTEQRAAQERYANLEQKYISLLEENGKLRLLIFSLQQENSRLRTIQQKMLDYIKGTTAKKD